MTVRAMEAKEVMQYILDNRKLFILDVRSEDNFKDWKIEGKSLDYLNIPYFELLDGVEGILEKIPNDKDVLVVCARERSSVMVAEMLSEAGLNVSYLEGGMKAWSEHLEPVKVGDLSDGAEIYQFVRVGKGCLSYVVISNGEAAIIDPTRITDVFLEFTKEKNVNITHVLDTHLHADHISGGREISKQTNATYWLPPKDATEVTFTYEPIEEDTVIKVGDTKVKIHSIHSPGHTSGSTSFIIDETYLLSGDTLFIDSIGRPDLAGLADDWVKDLRETLYRRYKDLSKELIVLPGHFMIMEEMNEDGSIAQRLETLFANNHGLNIESEEAFRKLVTENLPEQPNAYEDIRATNMGKVNPDLDKQKEMEIGPNRCAVR